jgi:predicted ATP-dependent endonuclease of OLD family
MRLISLQAHNFRGIREFATPIEIHDYTLFVGPNNSGKSTVIDAIRAFYEKDRYRYTAERDTPKGISGEESWIELGFALHNDEYVSLKHEYQIEQNRLVVRKYFESHDAHRIGKIFAYVKDNAGARVLAHESFYGASNVQNGKFGQMIYIPALSKVDDVTKMSGPSALRDLVHEIVGNSIINTPAYRLLAESVNEFSRDIRQSQNNNGHSIQHMQDEIDSELNSWNIKTTFSFVSPDQTDIFKNMFQLSIQDQSHGGELAVEQYGSGFQRQFIYTLIKMRAKYQRPSVQRASKEFQPEMTLLLFEEPEAFLHPQQQELLARELRKLAKDGTFQVVCSTHSATFVSRNSDQLTSIVRLRRNKLGMIETTQITDQKYAEIQATNIAIYQKIDAILKKAAIDGLATHDDDLQPQMEEIKYFMWLNPDRSSLFFARHVLLVEGYTEYVFINRLIADHLIEQADSGVYILECSGKLKMHAYMNILNALGISHSVLHDDDQINDDNRARQQREINQLIKDNRGPYTQYVHAIDRDLESFLAVSMRGINDARKPQHLLYRYAQGDIAQERIQAFCTLLNQCLVGDDG